MENQTIEKQNLSSSDMDREYYRCVFVSCDFSQRSLADIVFEECEFRQCNFSLTHLRVALRQVRFVDCKMTGTDFSGVNRFLTTLVFERSPLDYANFQELKMRRTVFRDCSLHEVSFDRTDLSFSVFENCDLMRATFSDACLEKTDFSSAHYFSIDPTACRLKGTIFSESGIRGLVSHLNIEIR